MHLACFFFLAQTDLWRFRLDHSSCDIFPGFFQEAQRSNFIYRQKLKLFGREQQGNTGQRPLLRALLGLEVERPDVGGTALARAVKRALVNALGLLLVQRHSLDENNRHVERQVLHQAVRDAVGVPACAFHVQAANVRALARRSRHFFARLLQHVHVQRHLVQWPFILARRHLHNGRQEGLRIEEASKPDNGRQLEL